MAILNCTPDSFFDGGVFPNLEAALAAAERAVDEGADLLDIGGESTRPGAARVEAAEQVRRTIPLIRAIRARNGSLGSIPITIDTTLAEVARAALDAGADAINDVSAGIDDPGMLALAASRGAGIVLMHRLRTPPADAYSDQYREPPVYRDVVADVAEYLSARTQAAERAGIPREGIVLDPGLGFGKTVEQNFELVRRTGELCGLGYPVLSAASRKSFVGKAQGMAVSEPGQRLPGSIAFSIMHYGAGARIFRVHDVAEQVRALRAAHAIATATAANHPESRPLGGGAGRP
jgi:dihydropteroate synthase